MDYSLEAFKRYVRDFMINHDLKGMEFLFAFDDEFIFRACGKGMVHPVGTPLEGVELWESVNDMLPASDRCDILVRTSGLS